MHKSKQESEEEIRKLRELLAEPIAEAKRKFAEMLPSADESIDEEKRRRIEATKLHGLPSHRPPCR